jgi:hypothetical protein
MNLFNPSKLASMELSDKYIVMKKRGRKLIKYLEARK